jgi:hypothetical protein
MDIVMGIFRKMFVRRQFNSIEELSGSARAEERIINRSGQTVSQPAWDLQVVHHDWRSFRLDRELTLEDIVFLLEPALEIISPDVSEQTEEQSRPQPFDIAPISFYGMLRFRASFVSVIDLLRHANMQPGYVSDTAAHQWLLNQIQRDFDKALCKLALRDACAKVRISPTSSGRISAALGREIDKQAMVQLRELVNSLKIVTAMLSNGVDWTERSAAYIFTSGMAEHLRILWTHIGSRANGCFGWVTRRLVVSWLQVSSRRVSYKFDE